MRPRRSRSTEDVMAVMARSSLGLYCGRLVPSRRPTPFYCKGPASVGRLPRNARAGDGTLGPPAAPGKGARAARAAASWLAARHRAHDQERLVARGHRVGQRGVGGLVGQVLLAGEESDERPALLRHLVADRAAQHRVRRLEGVEDGARGDRRGHVELHLAADLGEGPQVRGQDDADHGSVCASTATTDGRSRTMGAQLSPPSAEPYTWPPVVPKYTPQGSSASTAIASRSTFT